jgi:hypothetical protein
MSVLIVKCSVKDCPSSFEVIDSPPSNAKWTCNQCIGQCDFLLKLSWHPCHHCGLFGQDPEHADCECDAALKYDCPCNPGAVAFPLVLPAGGTERDWVNPEYRQEWIQDQIDKEFAIGKAKEAKQDREIAFANYSIRFAKQALELETAIPINFTLDVDRRAKGAQEKAAKRAHDERITLWDKRAVNRFSQELWDGYSIQDAAMCASAIDWNKYSDPTSEQSEKRQRANDVAGSALR